MSGPADSTLAMDVFSFARYGPGFRGLRLTDLLLEAHREGMLYANAEYSGCEGCYVEVAKWASKRDRYERYAFQKLFDSDLLTDYERAAVVAEAINELACCRYAPWVHLLPNYEGDG